MNKTINYSCLEEVINTTAEANALKIATETPLEYVERSTTLLVDFISRYIESEDGRHKLALAVEYHEDIIAAQLESILDFMIYSRNMLRECQTYELRQ